MDVNYRPHPPPPDLADVCRNELTRTDSHSSSITVVGDFLLRTTERDQHETWTNEKHNSYLGALEASFVKQLHQSLGLFSCRSEQKICKTSPSQKLPPGVTYLSDQRIKFVKHQRSLNHTTGPRERNLTQSERMPLQGKRNSPCRLTSLDQRVAHPTKSPPAISTTEEVSDQNFVDTEHEEKSNVLYRAKRSKIAAIDDFTTDQVVPSRNLITAEVSTAASKLAERVGTSS